MTALELERLLGELCTRCGAPAADANLCAECGAAARARTKASMAKRRAVLRELGLGTRWRGRLEDALRTAATRSLVHTLDPDPSIA